MAAKKRRTKPQPVKSKPVNNRPKRLRQWSDVSMAKALDAVAKGKMGVNRVALEFNVPSTTLKDRIAGRVVHGCNMGPKPYLTYEEENELVKFLMNCSKMGYGKTRQDVMKLVESCVVKKGITLEDNRGSKLSNGWWVRFIQRWPMLSLRKGDSFAVVREEASSYDVFKSYFDLLENVMIKHGLKGRPSQIYNCDESGMPLQHKVPKVISAKGCKKVRQVSSGNKTQITILGCASAAGQVIPPMVVFTGKYFNPQLSDGEVPGTAYGMSPNGWMDQELFSNWFLKHFLAHAVPERPLLLLLDGHSSHYTLELVKTAAEEKVIIFCLPPHTTADTQPLDTSCFGPLKTYWFETCRQYLFDNPGRVITKFQFSSLFAQAWSKGMTINNIVSGFRGAGIYPFAPNMILDKFPKPKSSTPQGTDSTINSSTPQGSGSAKKSSTSQGSDSTKQTSANNAKANLTPETIKLYEKRLENGYDVYTDMNYVGWLEEFHPDHLPPLDVLLGSVNQDSGPDSMGITDPDDHINILETPERLEGPSAATVLPEESVDKGPALDSASLTDPNDHINILETPERLEGPSAATLPPEESVDKGPAPDSASLTDPNDHINTPQVPVSLAGPPAVALPSEKKNVATPSGKENSPKWPNLNPVNSPELVRTPTTQKSLPANPVNRSPLSELLVYPQPSKKKSEGKKYAARVLTSVESIALLEEKQRKKIEEIEEKQRKKNEREMKKLAKEEEKKRKALEREAKKAEAEKKKRKGTTKKRPAKSSLASNSKWQKFVEDKTDDECEEVGLQHREISESECAACFGQWEDNEAEEWLQCTNDKCGVWSHAECLEKSDNAYVCVLCQTCFI